MNKCTAQSRSLFAFITCLTLANVSAANATSFVINNGDEITAQQTLDANGETGVINVGGQLTVDANDAIIVSSDNVQITNNGTVTSTTSNDAILLGTSSNVTITNSGTITGATNGINGSGNNITITNNGTITGEGINTIDLSGADSTITNNGTINSNAVRGTGIYGRGVGLIVNNFGIITSYDGIYTTGSNTTIINNGTVTSVGNGLETGGAESTIINNGTINSEGDGILADRNNSEIINNGTINSEGDGIYLDGYDSTITNNGAINALEYGIYVDNTSSTVTNNNSGGIINAIYGIYTEAEDNTVNNYGTIIGDTSDDDNTGIWSKEDNGIITNHHRGVITAYWGIYSEGDDDIIINNGTINSTILGLYVNGTNATITNNGVVNALNGDGIVSEGEATTIINNGSIYTYGNDSFYSRDAAAVDLSSDVDNDVTFINTGTIIAFGNAYQAIIGGDGEQTVTLGAGSRIIGTINLGGGDDSLTVSGSDISARIVTSNIENISLAAGVAGVVSGDVIHVVDPTSISMLSMGINNLNNNIHTVVGSRINDFAKNKDINNNQPSVWLQAFSGTFDRAAESSNLAYEHNNSGVIGGFDKKNDNGNGFGLVFGLNMGDFETDRQSFEGETTSFFTGAYTYLNLTESTTLSANLIGGYEKYQTKRHIVDNINGYQVADSNFNNLFISPSVSLEHRIKIGDMFELRPNASVNYLTSFFGKNQESGTQDANLTFQKRKIQAMNGNAGITAAVMFNNYEINLGGGVDSRVFNEEDASVTSGNSQFSFSSNHAKRVTGSYVTLGAKIMNIKGMTFSANVKIRKASGDENQSFGNLNAVYKF